MRNDYYFFTLDGEAEAAKDLLIICVPCGVEEGMDEGEALPFIAGKDDPLFHCEKCDAIIETAIVTGY